MVKVISQEADCEQPEEAESLIPWTDPAMSSKMNVTGDMAIIAETGVPPMRSGTSSDSLVLWGSVECGRSAGSAKVLGGSEVASRRSQFHRCLE